MDSASVVSGMDTENWLFAGSGVAVAALTALAVLSDADPVQVVMFGAFSLYLLGGASPAIDDRVPEYKRKGAIALGAVGVLGYLAGTQSALPLLFVLGGGMALLNVF